MIAGEWLSGCWRMVVRLSGRQCDGDGQSECVLVRVVDGVMTKGADDVVTGMAV